LYKSNMAKKGDSGRIENFNLFGERGDLPDVVHCETIDYRSREHSWELSAHRHPRLHQILLIESGGGHIDIDGTESVLQAGTCINLPAGVVHGFDFLPETQGWVITLAAEIVADSLEDAEGLRAYLDKPLIVRDCLHLKSYVAQLFKEYANTEFGRAHVLRSLCGVVMGLLTREAAKAERINEAATEEPLFRRFSALVEEHFSDHWPVAKYANVLAVSPGHLSRVCRQATGLSASGIIQERGVLEARRLLTYTNLTISQVAYELGYIDPAYFSRVFSRAYGISPRAFRRSLHFVPV